MTTPRYSIQNKTKHKGRRTCSNDRNKPWLKSDHASGPIHTGGLEPRDCFFTWPKCSEGRAQEAVPIRHSAASLDDWAYSHSLAPELSSGSRRRCRNDPPSDRALEYRMFYATFDRLESLLVGSPCRGWRPRIALGESRKAPRGLPSVRHSWTDVTAHFPIGPRRQDR
jgi:hypothetical protein